MINANKIRSTHVINTAIYILRYVDKLVKWFASNDNGFQALALSFNLVECPGKTTRAISLTETRLGPWHSCRRITQSAAILCESHCIIPFISSRDAKTRWRGRGVSKHRRAQYRFIVFTIAAFGCEISQMTRPCDVSGILSTLNNYFPICINDTSRECMPTRKEWFCSGLGVYA